MTGDSNSVPQSPQAPDPDDELIHAMIDKNGRLRVPPELLIQLKWATEPSLPVTYELVDAGCIRVWPGPAYDAAFAAAADDADAVTALRRVLRKGSWEARNRLNALPTSVRVHLLETGAVNGLVHVAVLEGCLLVVGDPNRLRGLALDRSTITDVLGLRFLNKSPS